MAEAMLRQPLPGRTFLNINVPKGEPKGYRVTVQAKRNHVTSVAERHDPKGHPYYWIEEGQNEWEPHDRSDYQAVRDGYVSVTPLHPDLTAHHALAAVEALVVREGSRQVGRVAPDPAHGGSHAQPSSRRRVVVAGRALALAAVQPARAAPPKRKPLGPERARGGPRARSRRSISRRRPTRRPTRRSPGTITS